MVALAATSIAWIILAIIVLGWITYALMNLRSARPELGSEVELAANRKPYYSDEVLEGSRLERVQMLGVLLLIVTVIALPLYWVFEPARMAGAKENSDERLSGWGANLFAPSAEGGFNCAGCHGGMNATGGAAPYTVTDPVTGEVRAVSWLAPALNTVLYRFSPEEITYILEYGRPGSPMSAWGLAGGGPMNSQQIESLVAYLETIQIPREDCVEAEAGDPNCPSGHLPAEMQDAIQQQAEAAVAAGEYDSLGEALFNLNAASGAYSCARCHTSGWSYGEPDETGQGGFGWNLTGAATNSHFPNTEDMVNFVAAGSVNGARYGQHGQGSGRMPAFGNLLTPDQLEAVIDYVRTTL